LLKKRSANTEANLKYNIFIIFVEFVESYIKCLSLSYKIYTAEKLEFIPVP
jgi:hypothetical protein